MPVVIREIQQEYEERLAEIRAATPHDKLQISGSRAGWPDVLAVYAVRTTTDSANPQEVATIDDGKAALLREIFWAMNPIEVHTEIRNISEGGTETTLYIRTASKTAQDMAGEYAFDGGQREQLSELLAPENRSLWNALLYGIGSGEDMVAVAVSQIGNVGGRPIGPGTAMTPAWSGAPVLSAGAPTSAVIWIPVCSPGFPTARRVFAGFRMRGAGRSGAI